MKRTYQPSKLVRKRRAWALDQKCKLKVAEKLLQEGEELKEENH